MGHGHQPSKDFIRFLGDRKEIQVGWWCKFHSEGRRKPVFQLYDRQKEFFLIQPFILFRSSMDRMRPIHIGDSNLLYSVYRFKCSSHLETPRNDGLWNTWELCVTTPLSKKPKDNRGDQNKDPRGNFLASATIAIANSKCSKTFSQISTKHPIRGLHTSVPLSITSCLPFNKKSQSILKNKHTKNHMKRQRASEPEPDMAETFWIIRLWI